MPRPPLPLLLTTVALVLAGCGDSRDAAVVDEPPAAQPTVSTATAEPAAPAPDTGSCSTKAEETGGKELPCPTASLVEGKANVVTFKTSEGSFDIALDVEGAPETANSFAYLVSKKFYDGLTFHRVVPDFVIQGGDPLGDTEQAGTGGPGFQVVEAPPAGVKYTRGVVAMAKGGADAPGASGSQFFVVSAADVGLPADYALVGKVSKGLATVDKITALGEGDGPPSKKVTITSATLAGR